MISGKSSHLQFSQIIAQLLKNPKVRRAYEELEPQFELAGKFIEARIAAGLTPSELAERMKSTQSVVARLESGKYMPSLSTLLRFAKAVGADRLTFEFSSASPASKTRNREIRLRA